MTHPNFDSEIVLKYKSQLTLINSFFDGVDSATSYLIQYGKESDKDFGIRKELARLSNYTREAVETIVALIFRHPFDVSEIEPTPLFPLLDKINSKDNLDTFGMQMATNLSKDGITYLLVERGLISENASKAESDAVPPYFVNISRGSVRNFKQSGNEFTQFTYNETYEVENGYQFETKVQQRCYVMRDNVCYVEIWRDDELYKTLVNPLGYIPIVQVGNDLTPYFYDLAVINRNHFNLKNEQRYYARQCAYPQRLAWGLPTDSKGSIDLGVSNMIVFDDTPSNSGMEILELSGNSIEVLEKLIIKDEEDMKKYIVGLIESGVQKTATEASLINANNESTLSNIAMMIEDSVNRGLEIMADYQGLTNYTAKVKINTEFIDDTLTAEQIAQLKDLFINNAISLDKLLDALVDGNILTFKDEKERETMKESLVLNGNL